MEDGLTPEQKVAEVKRLTALLRAREGKPGYTQNVAAIKARIEELSA